MRGDHEDLDGLESLLQREGQRFSYPTTLDVRAAVRSRLESETRRPRPWLWISVTSRRPSVAILIISLVGVIAAAALIAQIASREPPQHTIRAATITIGVFGSPRTSWEVNLAEDTMTELGLGGRRLETHSVGTGLDLVGLALTEDAEAPLAGVYVHGNLAFVGGASEGYTVTDNIGIRIIDLSDPANPELVGRIPLRSRGFFEDHTHGDAIVTRIETDSFHGDVAIVLNGVPDDYTPDDYPQPYGIWDVTDPTNPRFLSVLNLGFVRSGRDDGDLGDKPYDAKAAHGRYFYAVVDTANCPQETPRGIPCQLRDQPNPRLAIVDLSDPVNPTVVGEWQDDPQVSLMSLSINAEGTRAYLTGISPPPYGTATEKLFLYVLDIQNPGNPVEIGRYVRPAIGVHTPHAVPNESDTLVIFADGSWPVIGLPTRCAPHGRLHILDISDVKHVRELSSFKIDESDTCFEVTEDEFYQATDIAIHGDLVYSTWLKGGLRVIDISNPLDPVQVAEFRSPDEEGPWLSDIALFGDHAVTTSVWWSGMYIVRLR